eukprot:983333-Pyramimonas_sp.AAC.1
MRVIGLWYGCATGVLGLGSMGARRVYWGCDMGVWVHNGCTGAVVWGRDGCTGAVIAVGLSRGGGPSTALQVWGCVRMCGHGAVDVGVCAHVRARGCGHVFSV